jgi:hypothetical protein
MRTVKFCFFLFCTVFFFLTSCNTDEGYGGSASIEGRVFLVMHDADNFAIDKSGNYSLKTDTVVAREADIYVVFGDDPYYSEREKTGDNGQYLFKYLNPGNYSVYAFSKRPTGEKVAEKKTVSIKKGEKAVVEDIYVHEGKAYGTSAIKGTLKVNYYNRSCFSLGNFPAAGFRVYLKKEGEFTFSDDVRAADDGTFIFQKLLPGKYIVYIPGERMCDRNFEAEIVESDPVEVKETGKVYKVLSKDKKEEMVFIKNL